MRRPLYVANWKQNKTESETRQWIDAFREGLDASTPDADVAVAPPFTSLRTAGEQLVGSPVILAAQNLHWERDGAWTGEIGGQMLSDLSVRLVLVGHSERRSHFGDTDERVRRKSRTAREAGLVPVVCVGEDQEERDSGRTELVIERQLRAALSDVELRDGSEAVIAYEPVWAIGTGRSATPAQANDAHRFLRGIVGSLASGPSADAVRILYGGSVKPDTVASVACGSEVDGCLVGGASLDATTFLELVLAGVGTGSGR